jgi:hypothetical protein
LTGNEKHALLHPFCKLFVVIICPVHCYHTASVERVFWGWLKSLKK